MKLIGVLSSHSFVVVTPFAGVWIEMHYEGENTAALLLSLPSRECGLKSAGKTLKEVEDLSLPSRECGLKFREVESGMWEGVTPFAGVWIEITTHKQG